MSALEVFDGNGWTVRAFAQDGEPWFVARDVCDALLMGCYVWRNHYSTVVFNAAPSTAAFRPTPMNAHVLSRV